MDNLVMIGPMPPSVMESLSEKFNISRYWEAQRKKTRWAMGDLVVRNLLAHQNGMPTITPVV